MNIKIYTTNTCAYCAMVKKYLTNKGKAFEVINVDEQPERRQEAIDISGAMTVPVTVFEDDQNYPTSIIVGWNPGKLAAAIA